MDPRGPQLRLVGPESRDDAVLGVHSRFFLRRTTLNFRRICGSGSCSNIRRAAATNTGRDS
jgi:hypothetical protein